jgi:large subunit ribosomal protein L6
MSRIGKQPIDIPDGIVIEIKGQDIKITGPKGTLTRTIHPLVKVSQVDNQLLVKRTQESKLARSIHGSTRSLLHNMVVGVSQGYQKRLELVGTGYRVTKKGSGLTMTLGFSHPVDVAAVAGVELEVEGNKAILVRGIDKELVGQVTANIRALRPPEPYKGKGIRYSDEVVRRKPGKQAKVAAT